MDRSAAFAASAGARANATGLGSFLNAFPKEHVIDTHQQKMFGFTFGPLLNSTLEWYLLQNWFSGRPAYDAVFINSLSNTTQVGLVHIQMSWHTCCCSCCCASLVPYLLLLLFYHFFLCFLLGLFSVLSSPCCISLLLLLRLLELLCASQVINLSDALKHMVCFLGAEAAVCLHKTALLTLSCSPSVTSGKAVLDWLLP